MSDSRFDDFARALARPVRRRQALRTIGAAVAMAAIPALRPRTARAQGTSCDYSVEYDCYKTRLPEPDHWCCPIEGTRCGTQPGTCDPAPCPDGYFNCGIDCCPQGSRCVQPPGAGAESRYCETPCARPCGEACCADDEECVGGRCVRRCPSGRARCGSSCCKRGQRCVAGRCVKRCPEGRASCGDRCCPAGQRCDGGRCVKCGKGRRACGSRCCPRGQDCCTDAAGGFVCCDTKRRSCCATGTPGDTRMTCCPPKTTCAPEYDLTPLGTTAGIDRKRARTLCCPPARTVPGKGCCPPGHVSLGGKLVVPPGGGGGECCRKDKVCGSGRSVTCCSHVPGYEQDCVDGRCVRRSA